MCKLGLEQQSFGLGRNIGELEVQKKRSRRFSECTRPLSFQHGYLLPQSENFQGGIQTTAEEHADGSQGA